MAQIGTDINRAIDLLKANELVAIPTETVYGLAGNALDEEAIAKIYEVKNRPFFDPLIIHTDNLDHISHLVKEIPEVLKKLSKAFMPGPLTILLEKNDLVPDLITAGSEKVAIRIPQHPMTIELLSRLDFPLAAPSANPFGYISPTRASHVNDQLKDKISYILDGGPCQVGVESTIVELRDHQLIVLRKGGITVEALEEFGIEVVVNEVSSSNPIAPGMLESHYAPKVPVVINPKFQTIEKYNIERIGVLAFKKIKNLIPIENQLILSKNGDLQEAAQNLFAYMRILDGMDIDLIITETFPEEGLGRAINDKLRRAAKVP